VLLEEIDDELLIFAKTIQTARWRLEGMRMACPM